MAGETIFEGPDSYAGRKCSLGICGLSGEESGAGWRHACRVIKETIVGDLGRGKSSRDNATWGRLRKFEFIGAAEGRLPATARRTWITAGGSGISRGRA